MTDKKVYRVTYWDPCNGINGRAADRGLFSTREAAEAYVKPRAEGWDHDAYRIYEVPVND